MTHNILELLNERFREKLRSSSKPDMPDARGRGEWISRPTEAEFRAAAKLIPADTRSLTGRLFGDPLPGRSALDRRPT